MKKNRYTSSFFKLLLLALLVYLWFPGKSQRSLWTDGPLAYFYRPVQQLFLDISSFFGNTFNHYVFLMGVEDENDKLRKDLNERKLEIISLKSELLRYRKFQIAQHKFVFDGKKLLRAQIISEDLFVPSKTVMINRGKQHKVRVNDVVVSSEGLVGRVLKVYNLSSQVILMTDPNFRVDAMSQISDNRLIVRGVDSDLLMGKRYPLLTQSEYLDDVEAFATGEILVTSGFGGIYPKGIPVGKIADVKLRNTGLFSEADILPATDFTRLQFLYVLVHDPW